MTISSHIRKPVTVIGLFVLVVGILIYYLSFDEGFRYEFTEFIVTDIGAFAVVALVIVSYVLLYFAYQQLQGAVSLTINGATVVQQHLITKKREEFPLNKLLSVATRPGRLYGTSLTISHRLTDDFKQIAEATERVKQTIQSAYEDKNISTSERKQIAKVTAEYRKSVTAWRVCGLSASDAEQFATMLSSHMQRPVSHDA